MSILYLNLLLEMYVKSCDYHMTIICFLIQMCIRINNIHMIISIFPLLESHIYTTTLSPSSHTPFGSTAISSEASSGDIHKYSYYSYVGNYYYLGVQLGTDQPKAKTQRPFPHRYRPEIRKQQPLELLPQEGNTHY